MLLKLTADFLSTILSFQNERDLVVLVTMVSRLFSLNNKAVMDFMCRQLLAKKWNIPANVVHRELKHDKPSNLIRYASSVIGGICTGDDRVICDSVNNSVSFVGHVGESNRSVQCSDPCPSFSNIVPETSLLKSFVTSWQYYSCSKGKRGVAKEDRDVLQYKFSIPFYYLDGEKNERLFFDVRSVFYYEIHILPIIDLSDETIQTPDCVAVGLATKFFLKDRRFPGWDNESFGYHGDDGAIFHGRGRQLGTFGPTFGVNDVVGCGLNYKDMSIFFTLNGKYLGTAFSDIQFKSKSKGIDLYPTVGIDAHCTVRFNFGMKPFSFDLLSYINSK